LKILSLTLLIILVGCNTPNQLIKRSNRIKTKLEAKGVTIPKDTITVTQHDTIIETFTINDTVHTVKTITNTITLEPIVEYKTRYQTKIEYKEKIKYIKEETKQAKEKTKQVKAENRGLTWWLLWLGLGLGITGTLYIRK